MSADLAAFKQAFDRRQIHLNNAGLAPISRPARDMLRHWAERFYSDGFFSDEDYAAGVQRTRALIGRLIGADPARIAFFASTAYAVSQIALSLPLAPGDEVLMFDQEYGSHLFPWREACVRSGAQFVVAPSGPDLSAPVATLLQRLTPATKVVAVSSIGYQTGAKIDLPTLVAACKPRGIYVCVDAMQSIGLAPFDMQALGVDAVASGCHKWLASPVGIAFVALSDRLMAQLKPMALGSQSYGSCDLPTCMVDGLKSDAGRFEPGSKPAAELLALGASVELILATGVPTIQAEVARLSLALREGLAARGYHVLAPNGLAPDDLGGIVTFQATSACRWPGNSEVAAALKAGGVLAPLRGDGVRLSPHAFNTDADIAAALALL